MILGRKLRSFTAVDSGIVAPGLRKPDPLEAAEAAIGSAGSITAMAPMTLERSEEPKEDFNEERTRLWNLIGVLRKTNDRLWKTNRRLSKEVAALRSDLTGEELSVDSIIKSKEIAREKVLSS